MYTIIYNNEGNPVEVTDKPDYNNMPEGWEMQNRNDWKTREDAEAAAATACLVTHEVFIAVDKGAHVLPRFDIIQPPKVGDAVSYSFNGDTYPCGIITHVTEGTYRVVKTDAGDTFYRRGETSSWIKDSTWSLVKGHRDERNPSF